MTDNSASRDENEHRFSDEERRGVYRAIYGRRDVRSHFTSDQISDVVLARLLSAANHAPSVGFMQPWEFIIIRDSEVRRAIYENFENANRRASEAYEGNRLGRYEALKLEGIREAAINLCIVCDRTTSRGHGLGRNTMPETAIYSTVCAVQNLWLAARAEGIGVGWVSILDPDLLRQSLSIPENFEPVAYLCVGPVAEFEAVPELEAKGWEERRPLTAAVHFDRYGHPVQPDAADLLQLLEEDPLTEDTQ